MPDQFDNFAIDMSTSMGSDWKSGTGPAMRPFGTRISVYNANYVGARRADDYTRTTFGWGYEQNPWPQEGIGFGTDPGEFVYNPFVWGYAVAHRKMLADNLIMMGQGNINAPKMDVSDQDETSAVGMAQYKNYPTEGWSSFGKKADKEIPWMGNSWIYFKA